MLCEYGCGLEATYTTKTHKNICNRIVSKCPAINPKGKKKKSRRPAQIYTGALLCEFCNIHPATHILVNGKRCCSSTAGNCKEKRRLAAVKISKSRNTMDVSSGLKNSELIAKKGVITKTNKIDESGNNMHKIGAIKAANTKYSNIDESGLNVHQRNGKNFSEWTRTTKKGKEYRKKMSTCQKNILSKIDPVTGISEAKRRAKIMVQTKLNTLNDEGLNIFEQAHWRTNKNSGFINGIFWQYSNERKFLEKAVINGNIDKIKRGPPIKYMFEGEIKTYMPDYIMDKCIFEIKSRYTMFGHNNQYLKRNIAKLLAAKQSGYEVYVVIDQKETLLEVFLGSISNLLEGIVDQQLSVSKNSL